MDLEPIAKFRVPILIPGPGFPSMQCEQYTRCAMKNSNVEILGMTKPIILIARACHMKQVKNEFSDSIFSIILKVRKMTTTIVNCLHCSCV